MWSSRVVVGFAGFVVAGVLALPSAARAEGTSGEWAAPPAPPPPSSKAPERQEARVLIVTGAAVFTLTYLASAIGATTGFRSDTSIDSPRGALWIPAVGPFIAIGTASNHSAGVTTLYALDSAVQIASLSMFVAGLVLQHEGSMPTPTAAGAHAKLWTWTVAPTWSGSGPGAVLAGTF